MRRFAPPALAGLAALAVVALLAFGLKTAQGTSGGAVGSLAPSRALPVLGVPGQRRSLAAYRGKVVILNVFASWCPPCKTEAPLIEREQRRLAAAGDATVVGVTYNDAEPDARDFARRYGLSYPILRDADESVTGPLGVKGVPETFVLDRSGRIRAVSRGPVDAAFLQRAIREAS